MLIKYPGPILQTPPVICIISLCDGIILLVMGVEMIRKASTLNLRQELPQDARSLPGNPVLLGFVGSLANPDWIIWWVTIGLGLLTTADRFGIAGIIAFFFGHMSLLQEEQSVEPLRSGLQNGPLDLSIVNF